MYIFGERLKALREELGYDQKEMGKKLNLSASAYGYYEQGRNEPSLETLKKIAQTFQVSTDYLLGLSHTESHPVIYSVSDEVSLSEQELKAILKMKELSLLKEISKEPNENISRLNRYWKFIQSEHNA